MRRGIWNATSAVSLLMASAGHAQIPPSAAQTRQEQFNTASAAQQKDDCATALPIFDKLAQDPLIKPGSLSGAAIAVRRGQCLIAANRHDEGEASIEAGLPIMRNAGPEFAIDVEQAEMALGKAAADRHDHDATVQHYRAVLALVPEDRQVEPLLRLAMITAFDGGAQPLAYAEDALRIVSAKPQQDKRLLANIHDIHARILLNQGNVQQAYAELKQALDLSGGLTHQATHMDVELRGDLGQTALLTGDRDAARHYLAFTGAGRIKESPFRSALAMDAPECGDETGLKPQDSAIVEFAIADDGTVSNAQTVYSRGNFAVAAAFAKAVDRWFWQPESLTKLPVFYRTLTQVEMRCSNRGANLPSVETPLRNRFLKWADSAVSGGIVQRAVDDHALEPLKASADAAILRGDNQTAAAALGAWAILKPWLSQGALAAFDKSIALGGQAGIPREALHALTVLRMPKQLAVDSYKPGVPYRPHTLNTWAGYLPLASSPELADDPLAADTLVLMAIPDAPGRPDYGKSVELARRVADDARLPEHFPLRQVALLWLANQAAQWNGIDEAQAYFARTGLSEQQCALIGLQPAMSATHIGFNDYPDEAMRIGFEGWVRLEFNINADGSTAAARALISYPPFVFEEAATRVAKNFRYQPSYRPAGGAASSAKEESLNFVLR